MKVFSFIMYLYTCNLLTPFFFPMHNSLFLLGEENIRQKKLLFPAHFLKGVKIIPSTVPGKEQKLFVKLVNELVK